MSVPTKPNPTQTSGTRWNYVEIQVTDGARVLHPTHVAFDRLIFSDPPQLTSTQIEIVTINNGQSHSSQALVLPHEASATYIPIQLVKAT